MHGPGAAAGVARPVRTVTRRLRGVRARILVSYLVLLVFSTGATLVIERQVLFARLEGRIHDSLAQEVAELRRLVRGLDPRTGRPFGGDTQAIFDIYLARNVPEEGEVLITLLAGRPYQVARSSRGSPGALLGDPQLVARWAALRSPEEREISTSAGPVRYLAIPLVAGGRVGGVFVVANFIRGERREVEEALLFAGVVSTGVLLAASLLAFLAAGRVLAPVRELTDTARSIGETDLTRRIAAEGGDELAELARTFNAMLDRLEAGFAGQREFLDDVSHELRTPITIVRGHLELLEADPRELHETLQLVTEELDRMSRLVDDLLLLAKAGQPRVLRLRTVQLRPFCDNVIAKAEALGERRWSLARADDGVVVADPQRLTQALINLLSNAARHTRPGGSIELGAALAGPDVRFWVSDDGPGIDPADQERIFGRFAQAANGRRVQEGTGLGLAIVHAIVGAHSGRVSIDSEPGHGATFSIVIPVDQPQGSMEV